MTSTDADSADPVVLEKRSDHGTHLFGSTYAIAFVGVDEHGRSAPRMLAGSRRQ